MWQDSLISFWMATALGLRWTEDAAALCRRFFAISGTTVAREEDFFSAGWCASSGLDLGGFANSALLAVFAWFLDLSSVGYFRMALRLLAAAASVG